MNKNQLFLLILSLIGIYSCEKNSEEILPQYPITYKSYLISESEIKVYTKNGEITSSNLKNDIIQRFKIYLTDIENLEIDGKIEATYLAEDTVKLKIDNIEEEQPRLIYEKDSLIYWENQDTTVLRFPIRNNPHNSDFLLYTPLYYKEIYVPTATGYSTVFLGKECYYVIRGNDKLILPMFDLVYKNEFEATTITEINNKFIESFLSLIGDNDTIVYQKYNIEMK